MDQQPQQPETSAKNMEELNLFHAFGRWFQVVAAVGSSRRRFVFDCSFKSSGFRWLTSSGFGVLLLALGWRSTSSGFWVLLLALG